MKTLNFIPLVLALGFSQPSLGEETPKRDKVKPEKLMTSMDFDSTMVDGKMKAPAGFFLQGRNKQSLQSMVQLRSNFRDQLRNSKDAVRALVK
ncbi:MAG: hypothetical protein HRU19_13910 [Pseudobacteriovorax sp.]|nr:hypothetical protein [Pseudobacteriovorax sp.]